MGKFCPDSTHTRFKPEASSRDRGTGWARCRCRVPGPDTGRSSESFSSERDGKNKKKISYNPNNIKPRCRGVFGCVHSRRMLLPRKGVRQKFPSFQKETWTHSKYAMNNSIHTPLSSHFVNVKRTKILFSQTPNPNIKCWFWVKCMKGWLADRSRRLFKRHFLLRWFGTQSTDSKWYACHNKGSPDRERTHGAAGVCRDGDTRYRRPVRWSQPGWFRGSTQGQKQDMTSGGSTRTFAPFPT